MKLNSIKYLYLFLLFSNTCLAYKLDIGGIGALLMQPNSQYYHYSSGAYTGISSDKQTILLRASFIERPRFETQTHADGEMGIFSHIGTKITSDKNLYILCFFGAGRMFGYLQDLSSKDRRSYDVEGLSFQAEAVMNFSHLYLSISHQTFIAKDGNDQFEAYVVWPFNFVSIRMGVRI